MEEKPRYKYAVVRVKESAVVDFFGLIANHGYSDVSFVSNLSQAIARPDPNDENPLDESPSTKNDDRVAESEDRFSISGTPQSPSDEPKFSNLSNQIALLCANTDQNNSLPPDPELDLSATSTDLLSNLFATHSLPITKEWANDHRDSNSPTTGNGGPLRTATPQFKQMFQTRMKGWQREYIKDVINNGHYPTEEEMRDIEQKCDLSRKQVLRFISKRLSNPNRKPRTDWRSDKAAEGLTPLATMVKQETAP
ncbi:unnamed protein product [Auanema sp. JU1783]|nr:unnamed protein product [Auanema sp. JU1783]